jgi:hypothetical protein
MQEFGATTDLMRFGEIAPTLAESITIRCQSAIDTRRVHPTFAKIFGDWKSRL